MFDAVLFDLDNTLVDRNAAVEHLLCWQFGSEEIREGLRALDLDGLGCREALFEAWSSKTGKAMTQTLWVEQLSKYLASEPLLLQALHRLGESFQLGLVTNGGGASQRHKLKVTGLDKIFPQPFISGEVGWEKPDPRLFWRACSFLAVVPERCLYVGDQESIDGVGAKTAGMLFHKVDPGELATLVGWARLEERLQTGRLLADGVDRKQS